MSDTVRQAATLLSPASFDWCICGGLALDLFVGAKTRPHSDVDISAFWEDKPEAARHMVALGWRVYEACGGGRVRESITGEDRNLFCVREGNPACTVTPLGHGCHAFEYHREDQGELDYLEFLFSHRVGGNICYHPESSVRLELSKAILVMEGIPVMAPELCLLHKSVYADKPGKAEESKHDLNSVLPLLSDESRGWLLEALHTTYPQGHGWIGLLS